MTKVGMERLIELAGGDRELIEMLVREGAIVEQDEGFSPEDVDCVLVSRTLIRELDVNWAGVDIILRLRRQLAMARLRLVELEEEGGED